MKRGFTGSLLYVSVAGRSLPRPFQARGLDHAELLYEVDYGANFAFK